MVLTRKHYIIGGFAVVLLVLLMVLGVSALRGDPTPPRDAEISTEGTRPPDDPSSTDLPTPSNWPVTPTPRPTGDLILGEGQFPVPEEADPASKEEVATTFALMTASMDTVKDRNEQAALDRALALAAPELTAAPPPVGSPGLEWTRAADCKAYSDAEAEVIPVPHHVTEEKLVYPATGEVIEPFTVQVSYTWRCREAGEDGKKQDILVDGFRTVFLSLVEREGQWQVIEYGYAGSVPEQG